MYGVEKNCENIFAQKNMLCEIFIIMYIGNREEKKNETYQTSQIIFSCVAVVWMHDVWAG